MGNHCHFDVYHTDLLSTNVSCVLSKDSGQILKGGMLKGIVLPMLDLTVL